MSNCFGSNLMGGSWGFLQAVELRFCMSSGSKIAACIEQMMMMILLHVSGFKDCIWQSSCRLSFLPFIVAFIKLHICKLFNSLCCEYLHIFPFLSDPCIPGVDPCSSWINFYSKKGWFGPNSYNVQDIFCLQQSLQIWWTPGVSNYNFKGIGPQSIKSHILISNGVWYYMLSSKGP